MTDADFSTRNEAQNGSQSDEERQHAAPLEELSGLGRGLSSAKAAESPGESPGDTPGNISAEILPDISVGAPKNSPVERAWLDRAYEYGNGLRHSGESIERDRAYIIATGAWGSFGVKDTWERKIMPLREPYIEDVTSTAGSPTPVRRAALRAQWIAVCAEGVAGVPRGDYQDYLPSAANPS